MLQKRIEKRAELYKKIAETQVPNIVSIRRALGIVRNYIANHKLKIYGGMAIDFALKYFGFPGIYDSDVLPDYDFFSPNNIEESVLIADELYRAGYENVAPINGRHLITRRVRINRYEVVADVSYFADPYFECIPCLESDGLIFVHPYFQKIDLYRSLAFLYEGTPGREYFRKRLTKDLSRLKLLNQIRDDNFHKLLGPPVNADYMVGNLYGKLLEHDLDSSSRYILKKNSTNLLEKNICYTGFAALAIICHEIGRDYRYTVLSSNRRKIRIPGRLEYFVDAEWAGEKGQLFEKTFDLYPQALMTDREMIYFSHGERFAATEVGGVWVTSIYYLAAQFMFKYLATSEPDYWEAFCVCEKIISSSSNKFDEGPNKFGEEQEEACSATTVNAGYFGNTYIDKTWFYSEKKELTTIAGETEYYPRPLIGYHFERDSVYYGVENYITYRVDGKKKDTYESRTL